MVIDLGDGAARREDGDRAAIVARFVDQDLLEAATVGIDLLDEDGPRPDIGEGAVTDAEIVVGLLEVIGEGAVAIAPERLQPAHHHEVDAGEDHAQHEECCEAAGNRRAGGLKHARLGTDGELPHHREAAPVQGQRQHEAEIVRNEGGQHERHDQHALVVAQHEVEDDEKARRRKDEESDQNGCARGYQAASQYIAVDDRQNRSASLPGTQTT